VHLQRGCQRAKVQRDDLSCEYLLLCDDDDMSALIRSKGQSDDLRDPGLAAFQMSRISKPKGTPVTVCFGEVQDRQRRVLAMTWRGIG
jgi:hypothetical protein